MLGLGFQLQKNDINESILNSTTFFVNRINRSDSLKLIKTRLLSRIS
jgi:hypothetical protein